MRSSNTHTHTIVERRTPKTIVPNGEHRVASKQAGGQLSNAECLILLCRTANIEQQENKEEDNCRTLNREHNCAEQRAIIAGAYVQQKR
jgi:hypothetical protein